MKSLILTQERGLVIARRMKKKLLQQGIPVVHVYLFGSLAHGTPHDGSDIDIAVVHEPFESDRFEEQSRVSGAREDFDIPMDIVCLHTADMENRYSTIVQELKRYGIPV